MGVCKNACIAPSILVPVRSCQDPSVYDMHRAKTKVPRPSFKGHGQAGLSKILNGHLIASESRVRPCKQWSPQQLQAFMLKLNEHRSPELQKVYKSTDDRRALVRGSAKEYQDHWTKLNEVAEAHPHLLEPHRETHCREAVMWWTHHLTAEKREMMRKTNITIPLLPEGEKKPCDGMSDDEKHLCVSLEQPNSCDWCHSTQAKHDAGVPGTTAPNALNPKFHGPDDGNPHGWDRKRRCDQDQMPRCQPCEGIGGHAYGDAND